MPRIGFSFVDVRDVADLQIRAMTTPEAGGERFIAVGAVPLDGGGRRDPARPPRRRRGEGADARRCPTSWSARWASSIPASARSSASSAARSSYSSEKARTSLGWTTRPIEETVVETARSMV